MALFDLFSFFTGVIAVLPSTSSMGENGPIFTGKTTLFLKIILLSCGPKQPLTKGLIFGSIHRGQNGPSVRDRSLFIAPEGGGAEEKLYSYNIFSLPPLKTSGILKAPSTKEIKKINFGDHPFKSNFAIW